MRGKGILSKKQQTRMDTFIRGEEGQRDAFKQKGLVTHSAWSTRGQNKKKQKRDCWVAANYGEDPKEKGSGGRYGMRKQ